MKATPEQLKQGTKDILFLQDYKVIGNAYHDSDALDLCHSVVVRHFLPMSMRIEALSQIDRIMGVECPAPTWEDVAEYMEGFGEECDAEVYGGR
jgi:hypothetical protein